MSRAIAASSAVVAAVVVRLWALPVSLLATPLILIALLTGGRARVRRGVLESDGGWLPGLLARIRPGLGIQAMTFGHVVVARDAVAQALHRRHEREHVRQCERWGLLFPLAYLVASGVALARGRNAYFDNVFEVQARRAEAADEVATMPEASGRSCS